MRLHVDQLLPTPLALHLVLVLIALKPMYLLQRAEVELAKSYAGCSSVGLPRQQRAMPSVLSANIFEPVDKMDEVLTGLPNLNPKGGTGIEVRKFL